MWTFLGILLIAAGCFQLAFNEFTVQLKRSAKSWWRDDKNPRHDRWLAEVLRAVTFISGVVMVELGFYLTGFALPLAVRVTVYTLAGIIAVFVRLRIVGVRW